MRFPPWALPEASTATPMQSSMPRSSRAWRSTGRPRRSADARSADPSAIPSARRGPDSALRLRAGHPRCGRRLPARRRNGDAASAARGRWSRRRGRQPAPATGGAVEGLEETALRALTKLQQVLPPRLGRRVDALQSHTVSVSGHRRGPQVEGRLLALIAATARDREIMRFRYADHSDRAPSAGLSLTACDHRSRHPPPESLHSLQPDRTRSRRLRPSAV